VSWDCPHFAKDICKLNGIRCLPTKGNCVLRGKFEIVPYSKPTWEKKKEKSNQNRNLKTSNQ